MSLFGRSSQTLVGRWFWTIDRVLLTLLLLLIGIGVVAVFSASPAAAVRYSDATHRVPDLYYFYRHVMWVAIGVPVLLGVSMMPVIWLRRLCVFTFPLLLGLLFALPWVGSKANGAVRWLTFAGVQVQPSEFMKPVFIVLTAWLLASRFEDRRVPALATSFTLMLCLCGLLVIQPDYGQTLLVGLIWFAQAALAGLPLIVMAACIMGGIGFLVGAFFLVPHVRDRLMEWMHGAGDTFQADAAIAAFRAGGLFGTGPSEGHMKLALPEAHTDYIFAVTGEEFGMIACFCLALLYLAIIVRVLLQLLDEDEPFLFLATAGLVAQFGVQAFINMAVNLSLLPSKGMTLPFVSHGGSSFVAIAFAMGMALAFTRQVRALKASPWQPGAVARGLA